MQMEIYWCQTNAARFKTTRRRFHLQFLSGWSLRVGFKTRLGGSCKCSDPIKTLRVPFKTILRKVKVEESPHYDLEPV